MPLIVLPVKQRKGEDKIIQSVLTTEKFTAKQMRFLAPTKYQQQSKKQTQGLK